LPAGFDGSCCQQKSTVTTDSEGQGHKIQSRSLLTSFFHTQPAPWLEWHAGVLIRHHRPPSGLLQFQLVLEVALTDMVSQNGQEHLLIICAVCNLLHQINMPVFRSLGAETLRPSKPDKLVHLVQNTVCLLQFPCVLHTILFNLRKCCLQLHRLFLTPRQLGCRHV
jgi:hypothetical protein